jgi:hypothetical protein
MVSSTILTLVVIPAAYSLWKERQLASATATEAMLLPATGRRAHLAEL